MCLTRDHAKYNPITTPTPEPKYFKYDIEVLLIKRHYNYKDKHHLTQYPKNFFNFKVTEISFSLYNQIHRFGSLQISDVCHHQNCICRLRRYSLISSLLKLRTLLTFAIRIVSLLHNLCITSLSNSSTAKLAIHETLNISGPW